jgi:hypothetical protein
MINFAELDAQNFEETAAEGGLRLSRKRER